MKIKESPYKTASGERLYYCGSPIPLKLPQGQVACRPEPLLAQPGGLALGRAEVAPEAPAVDSDPLYDLRLTPEQAVSLKALADLLASPEPPKEFAAEVGFDLDGDHWPADLAWDWLRRQAGLEG